MLAAATLALMAVSAYAWNPVILNKTVECARCAAALARGQRGYAGLGRGPTAWLSVRV